MRIYGQYTRTHDISGGEKPRRVSSVVDTGCVKFRHNGTRRPFKSPVARRASSAVSFAVYEKSLLRSSILHSSLHNSGIVARAKEYSTLYVNFSQKVE